MRLLSLPALLAGILFITTAIADPPAENSFPALSGSAASTAGPSSTDASSAAATTTGASSASASSAGPSFPALSSSFPIPSPSVPPTQMAPFMQTSPLPNNFVFICAGAIIGFFFLIVLAWRGLVSWSIYRNIERANAGRTPYTALTKIQKFGAEGASMLKRPNAPFYSHGPGSALSLDPLTGGGNKSGVYSTSGNRSSLFFSPTASATAVTSGPSAAGNRNSVYLPAGYYAAGQSSQGGGVAANGRPISMTDFTSTRPLSQGYSRQLSAGAMPSPGPSPMIKPETPPTDAQYGRSSMARMSTQSLGAKSDGRAPSAYLEDLFDYPPVPERSVSGESRRQF